MPEDLIFLGYPPGDTEVAGARTTWRYVFHRRQPRHERSESGGEIVVRIDFESGKLRRVHFPPELHRMIPPDLPATFLKALGYAELNIAAKRLRFSAFNKVKLPLISLPAFSDVEDALGTAIERKDMNEQLYSAKYILNCNTSGGSLGLTFTGVFRKHLQTMRAGTVVLGWHRLDFTEDSLEISDVRDRGK